MIGVYDYTVVLTYLSLLSASSGIMVSLWGKGHPFIGIFFLLLCGLFDAFDGKVARTKANRSELEKKFGVQIDSLSDLVAFGVLPACIGASLIKNELFLKRVLPNRAPVMVNKLLYGLFFACLILYVLAALIRLAYFNVEEEERQKTESCPRKYFTGVPVTTAALIFPSVMLLQYIFSPADIAVLYFICMIVTGFLFVSRIQIPKPGTRGVLVMVGIGTVEVALFVLYFFVFKHRVG